MRKKIAAGNWKMNLTKSEALGLAAEVLRNFDGQILDDVQVIFGPSYVYLDDLHQMVKNHPGFAIAAQNVHQEAKGAYTAEVSASMIASLGVEYVIIGHSERRQYFNEDNALLAKKLDIALANGLLPIYCIGERLEEREAGKTMEVVETQMAEGTGHLTADQFAKLVIAYEPVWAIGTGKTASPAQAQEVHAFLRNWVKGKFGEAAAQGCSILYGGSVKPANAKELFSQPDIDGGLVGGASLKADSFTEIIRSF
jgi:triosephosphate isomerase